MAPRGAATVARPPPPRARGAALRPLLGVGSRPGPQGAPPEEAAAASGGATTARRSRRAAPPARAQRWRPPCRRRRATRTCIPVEGASCQPQSGRGWGRWGFRGCSAECVTGAASVREAGRQGGPRGSAACRCAHPLHQLRGAAASSPRSAARSRGSAASSRARSARRPRRASTAAGRW